MIEIKEKPGNARLYVVTAVQSGGTECCVSVCVCV